MKLSEIKNPITSLSGIGPATEKLFSRLGIFTIFDLLTFYPKSYEDRTKIVPLKDFRKSKVHCVATVTSHEWFGYGKMKTLKIKISDGELDASLVAFNRSFLQNQFLPGSIICVSGSFDIRYNSLQSSSFEITKLSSSGILDDFKNIVLPDSKIFPIYSLTEGLSQKIVRKVVGQALQKYSKGIDDELPEKFIQRHALISKSSAIEKIHTAKTFDELQKARNTLVYEEFFFFQKMIAERALAHKGILPKLSIEEQISDKKKNISSEEFEKNLSPLQKEFLKIIPFNLTDDQKNVIDEMNNDIDRGFRERSHLLQCENFSGHPFTMARLLQGDVGSGKTLVAFFAVLRVINWKGQCAIMAPTEILAKQHAEEAAKLFSSLGIRIAFLSGNVKSKGRSELLKQLKDGNIDVVIGTHALFSSNVVYNDLQLAVIDEQHRFGVLQRQSIIEKGRKIEGTSSYTLHLLMMSATPIPQTLALTLFGDLDVSTLHSMPEGRKKIITYLVKEGNELNAYEAVRKELQKGRQAYFVYPAIESFSEDDFFNADNAIPENHFIENDESEKVQHRNFRKLKSAEDMFKHLQENVYPEYKCALVHSKISEDIQESILKDFKNAKVQVLAATTVIEVGVNIPNATCMVIEQADRFGLAQLHQLRGRVGRGHEQSFCFLIYSKNITKQGVERMKVLRESTDGFFIAEKDLKLRGPGEIHGKLQAGALQFDIADIEKDYETLVKARNDAFSFVSENT